MFEEKVERNIKNAEYLFINEYRWYAKMKLMHWHTASLIPSSSADREHSNQNIQMLRRKDKLSVKVEPI